jgi:hypothetical protein
MNACGADLGHSVPHVPVGFWLRVARYAQGSLAKALDLSHFGRWRGGRVVEGAPLLREAHSLTHQRLSWCTVRDLGLSEVKRQRRGERDERDSYNPARRGSSARACEADPVANVMATGTVAQAVRSWLSCAWVASIASIERLRRLRR